MFRPVAAALVCVWPSRAVEKGVIDLQICQQRARALQPENVSLKYLANQQDLRRELPSFDLKPISPTPVFDDDEVGEDIPELVREWFFENFEDPADNTPFESAEGGYQWVYGGPYDAREEIELAFPDVEEEVLEDIISDIEAEGIEWAPHVDRIIDRSDKDPPVSEYEAMQAAIKELQAAVKELKPFSSTIGGNNPPEEIGLPPYDEQDKKEIEEAIDILLGPATELSANPVVVASSAEVLKSKSEHIKDFVSRHGDKFVENFAGQLGKRAADSLTLAGWLKFSGLLLAAYEATQAFVTSIGIPWPF
ncbi:hypothetical protein ATY75_29075 [Rhizobium sp. N122]|uniref:hypothetical protein n=1 Tax=Rhizobium sp. N122 TaxID=1764272 RepID=UPI000B5A537F|nr:hypothetical protein [Rhizobium sp. N122]OWV78065.1 hypothetical protein ATY75_29075 [Rhizobium sp. N122]